MAFNFKSTIELKEVIIIDGEMFDDERGFFSERYKQSEFMANGIPEFVQENHSHSSKLCFRGFHYQANPSAQGKLVYVTKGQIIDYALDIRPNSKTFGKITGVTLDDLRNRSLYIPPGFAHGFFVIEEADVVYKVTNYYSPKDEGIIGYKGIIKLPDNIIVSDKDNNGNSLISLL